MAAAACPTSIRPTTTAGSLQAPNPYEARYRAIPEPARPTASSTTRPVNGTPTDPSLVGSISATATTSVFGREVQYQRNFDNHSYLRVLGLQRVLGLAHQRPERRAAGRSPPDPAEYDVLGMDLRRRRDLFQSARLAELVYGRSVVQHADAADVRRRVRRAAGRTRAAPTGLGTILSSYVGTNGNCYNFVTGEQWSCFDAGSQGGSSHAASGCPRPQNFPYI